MAKKRFQQKQEVFVLLLAITVGGFFLFRLTQRRVPAALAPPVEGTRPMMPSWSNSERWEIERGQNDRITAITVHRDVQVPDAGR